MVSRSMTTVLGGLLLMAAARPLCAQPFFVSIGDFGGNSSGSDATDISPDGSVVAGENHWPILYSEVVRWTPDQGMFSLTPGRASRAGGISWSGGVIVGGFPGNYTYEAFRWTASEGAVGLGDLDGGGFRSGAGGISARGDIIVGGSWSEYGDWEAYRWTTETGMVGLGDLPGGVFSSGAQNISANGKVIVGHGRTVEGQQAFRWTAGEGMVGLGDLPGGSYRSVAWAVSADGSVIVGDSFDARGERAFRWTEQTGMVALDEGLENLVTQQAYGTSWDGDVVVGYMSIHDGGFGAFYWTAEGGTRWLTDVLADHGAIVPDGWHLLRATGVSADGRTIVGFGTPPQGEAGGGWVAYLGPACRADYDDDGSVNTADVIAYLGAWSQRSIFADWNYDGYIDTRDVIGFLGEWVAKPGC